MSKTYSSSYYELIDRVEREHFWFRSRNIMLTKLFRRFLSPRSTFFEIGTGTGLTMELLEKIGMTVTGLDVNKQAVTFAKQRTKGKLIHQSIYSFHPKTKFDAVGAFDVLEHQQDDELFLIKVRELLKPGGYFFVTVPAGAFLWNRIDEVSGHKRRYESGGLTRKLMDLGFTIEFWNYWNWITLPFYMMKRNFQKPGTKDALISWYIQKPPPPMNRFFSLLLRFELFLLFHMKPPGGSSLVIVAKYP